MNPFDNLRDQLFRIGVEFNDSGHSTTLFRHTVNQKAVGRRTYADCPKTNLVSGALADLCDNLRLVADVTIREHHDNTHPYRVYRFVEHHPDPLEHLRSAAAANLLREVQGATDIFLCRRDRFFKQPVCTAGKGDNLHRVIRLAETEKVTHCLFHFLGGFTAHRTGNVNEKNYFARRGFGEFCVEFRLNHEHKIALVRSLGVRQNRHFRLFTDDSVLHHKILVWN